MKFVDDDNDDDDDKSVTNYMYMRQFKSGNFFLRHSVKMTRQYFHHKVIRLSIVSYSDFCTRAIGP